MKRFFRRLCLVLTPLCLAVQVAVGVCAAAVPSSYVVAEGSALELPPPLTVSDAAGGETSVRLLGVFPVKSVSVRQAADMQVVLGGEVFGMKMYTDGVLVVGMTAVDTQNGNRNPAKEAGICKGDLIQSINGVNVTTKGQVAKLIEQSNGTPLAVTVKRDGVIFPVQFSAVYSVGEGCYKAGLWVRDSTAGLGTMTFYHPASGVFAGLGHPVCDVDTGAILPISEGEAVPADVYSVNRSVAGNAGSLCGGFAGRAFGELCQNGANGVYGTASQWRGDGEMIAVAPQQDVKTGAAQIRCTVAGSTPGWYDVKITKVRRTGDREDLHIEVTDPDLLSATGGIVQGMSGSPIVQNGKLVGAVTHVLVDTPTKGYGIFAEDMLETAQTIGDNVRQGLSPAA